MLLLRFTWASFIKHASTWVIFSEKRRLKLERSARKRIVRLLPLMEGHLSIKAPEQISYVAEASLNLAGDTQSLVEDTQSLVEDTQLKKRIANLEPLGGNTPEYKLLLVCMHAPTVNHAGGLRILDIVKMIKTNIPNSYVEIFTPANKALYGPIDTAIHIADRIVVANDYNFSLSEYLRQSPISHQFDVIDFQFPQPIDVIRSYRKIGRKIIFTPMESLIRNELLGRISSENVEAELTSLEALLEVDIINSVDQTVCVSEMDRAAIEPHVEANIVAIETGVSGIEFSDDIQPITEAAAASVCYVAYFGSQTNRDALKWYLDEVHPRVVSEIPEYELSIIGRGDIKDILDPMPQGIKHVGEVDRIGPYIKSAAIGIAPALSGSGFRGKINQYAFLGLPTVASPLSAEGLAYVDGKSIFVAEKPEDFASNIVQLIKDQPLREQMATQAFEVTSNNYTWSSKWPALADAYGLPLQVEKFSAPTVHAIIPSYQHAAFIEERIRSVFAQEYSHIRVTVIDDHSMDNSDEIIRKLQEEFEFDYIRRDQNSGTPFSAWEYAAQNTTEDLIWICESDDAADSMFLASLTKLMLSRSSAKVAYCGSWLVDADGAKIGSTTDYHSEHFHPNRWRNAFFSDGKSELKRFLRFGMIVPNMSSALIDRDVFRKAFTPNIKDYRLAGDWLFMGQAMCHGDVVFTPKLLNRFRSHEQTSRHITNSVRTIAEHVSVRLTLSYLANTDEYEQMEAVKHDLWEISSKRDLIEPVLLELQQIDPRNMNSFKALIKVHLTDNKMSESLEAALGITER